MMVIMVPTGARRGFDCNEDLRNVNDEDLLNTGARGGSGAGDQVWGARRDRGGGRQEWQLSHVSTMSMIGLVIRM